MHTTINTFMFLILAASAVFVAVLWLNKKWARFRKLCGSLSSNLAVSFIIAGCTVGLVLLALRLTIGDKPNGWLGGITVEGFGFLFDIILFGIILYALEDRRERKKQVSEYHHQLTDFLRWHEKEGVYRKVGIIRRLNELGAPLPNLDRVSLQGAKLRDADFDGAMLVGAKLLGADLTGTVLYGADLSDALLYDAILTDADLRMTSLRGAKLCVHHHSGLEFNEKRYQACLMDADLSQADMFGADVKWMQVKKAKNWDKAASYPENVIEEAKADGVDLTHLRPSESDED